MAPCWGCGDGVGNRVDEEGGEDYAQRNQKPAKGRPVVMKTNFEPRKTASRVPVHLVYWRLLPLLRILKRHTCTCSDAWEDCHLDRRRDD